MNIKQRILAAKNQVAIISGILILIALVSKFFLNESLIYEVSMIIASVLGFLPIGLQAYQAIRIKVISIDLLVTIAVIGAFLIGEYNESAIVTFLFLFGNLLEQKTLEKTRSAIKKLTQLAPASALKIKAHEIEKIDIEEVAVGDILLVKTGAQVPVDGVITQGWGHVNEASVTGESQLVKKKIGDSVFSGTLLENGTLQVRAEKIGEDTTFGKIIELVEEAQDNKSAAEGFITTFAKYYTPIILVLAVVLGWITQDVKLAITVLVLGCPGALVIGVPVSNVAGIGNGAQNGILIKGGEVIDHFKQVDTFVFDKTGTLTEGIPTVAKNIEYSNEFPHSVDYAASIEKESNHPLGRAIIDLAKDSDQKVTNTIVVKGKGITATVDEHQVLVGNQKLLADYQIELPDQVQKDLTDLQENGQSIGLIVVDQQVTNLIGIRDQAREGAKETLANLKKMGAKRLIMLTGDNQRTAEIVGKELGLEEVYGNLLPEEKSRFIKKLQQTGNKVAFIGDGVNDSPSIALADIGIAMGNGTDIAIETSDVVLMNSDFNKLVQAYGLTKKTFLNMQENILIAIATVIFLMLGLVFGYIYMASGMLAHEISILIVILNGMRLLTYHKKLDSYQGNHPRTAL